MTDTAREQRRRTKAELCGSDVEWVVPDWAKARSHVVYFAWSGDRLLYVGVTSGFVSRMGNHALTSVWWRDVDRVTFHEHDTRSEAAVCESANITDLKPPYNTNNTPIARVDRVDRSHPRDEGAWALRSLLRELRRFGWPAL